MNNRATGLDDLSGWEEVKIHDGASGTYKDDEKKKSSLSEANLTLEN